MEFTNTKIIEEISRKLAMLQSRNQCLFRSFLDKRYRDHIEKDATIHSYVMEHPNENFNRFNGHANKRRKKQGIKNLGRAFAWSNTNFSPDKITEDYIKKMAGKIDPDFHSYYPAEYRQFGKPDSQGKVHFTGVRAGQRFTPPGPEKIGSEMRDFVIELNSLLIDKTIHSLIEGSAYAHLNLVRIHPFEDTNGRTSRMLQNTILKYAGLPPPIIYAGERFDYYKHLEEACLGHRRRMGDPKKRDHSEGEVSFYNYLAGKVSASLDRALGNNN